MDCKSFARGLQEVRGGYQRLYVVTGGNKELYEVTVCYRGIKVVVTKVTLVTKITLVTIVS